MLCLIRLITTPLSTSLHSKDLTRVSIARDQANVLFKQITPQHTILCSALQFKGFERVGISRDQAEELSHQITALIVLNKEKMDQTFVKQQTLDRVSHF